MNFDMEKVMADMLSAMKGTVGSKWNEVQSTANQFLQNKKDRLQQLADMRIDNELSDDDFKSRLADEQLIAEAELNALAVLSKATVQQAANAAMDVLLKAVKLTVYSCKL
jgi:hypothetical protein